MALVIAVRAGGALSVDQLPRGKLASGSAVHLNERGIRAAESPDRQLAFLNPPRYQPSRASKLKKFSSRFLNHPLHVPARENAVVKSDARGYLGIRIA